MTLEEAYNLLSSRKNFVISSIYDEPGISTAILTIRPKFEYPDWSHEKVSKFLQYCSTHQPPTQFRISRHEERLKPVIEAAQHAWKIPENDQETPLVMMVSDLFFYCDEFGLDPEKIIKQGKSTFETRRKEASNG